MNKKQNNVGGKTVGGSSWCNPPKKTKSESVKKEWKFTLDPWHELPDIHAFIGSTFVISRIDMERMDLGAYKYDIYISPISQECANANLYPSVMSVTERLNKERKRNGKASASKRPSKK